MVNKRRKKKKVVFYAKKGEIERTNFDDGSRSISMTPELEEAFKEQEKRLLKSLAGNLDPMIPYSLIPMLILHNLILKKSLRRK